MELPVGHVTGDLPERADIAAHLPSFPHDSLSVTYKEYAPSARI